MADPLIVLLIVTLAESKDATAPAMTFSARRALGAEAIVLVNERAELPADADALALAANVRARGVVEVAWADQSARLHVHVEDGAQWIDRELRFAPEDSPQERGRTIGLALATMIRERAPPSEPPAPVPPAHPTEGPARAPVLPPPVRALRRWGLELVGVGGFGLGGEAAGGGASVAGRAYATEDLAARMGAGARLGALPAASASFYTLVLSGGGAARLFAAGPLAGGLRADALVTRFAVRREGLERARWLAGAALMVEAEGRVAPDTYLLGAIGSEVFLGPTDVDVGQSLQTRVPIARLAFELGIRQRL